jgi:hypothetical protein
VPDVKAAFPKIKSEAIVFVPEEVSVTDNTAPFKVLEPPVITLLNWKSEPL